MTWTDHHRRSDVLRGVLAAADARRDGVLPLDLPGVRDAFGDELGLLGALLLRWHTRLAGRIDAGLAAPDAWRRTAEEMPGVRAVIDRCTDHPLDEAMARATAVAAAKERDLLRGRCGTLVA